MRKIKKFGEILAWVLPAITLIFALGIAYNQFKTVEKKIADMEFLVNGIHNEVQEIKTATEVLKVKIEMNLNQKGNAKTSE